MDFHCDCSDPDCYCNIEVTISLEEQNEIILSRILAESMEYEIYTAKVCDECAKNMHLLDPDTEERTFKDPVMPSAPTGPEKEG